MSTRAVDGGIAQRTSRGCSTGGNKVEEESKKGYRQRIQEQYMSNEKDLLTAHFLVMIEQRRREGIAEGGKKSEVEKS